MLVTGCLLCLLDAEDDCHLFIALLLIMCGMLCFEGLGLTG